MFSKRKEKVAFKSTLILLLSMQKWVESDCPRWAEKAVSKCAYKAELPLPISVLSPSTPASQILNACDTLAFWCDVYGVHMGSQQTGSTGGLQLCHTASRTDACWPELLGNRLQRLSTLQQAGRLLFWKSITDLSHPLTPTTQTTHASPWLLPLLQWSLLVWCVKFLLSEWVPASIKNLFSLSSVGTYFNIWWTEFHLLKSE